MKPYEVEIFDREFNFIYNALLDGSEFSYKYDAISPSKNNIRITKEFDPQKLSDEASAPNGWFIRIFRDSEAYYGVISSFDKGKTYSTIEYEQLGSLFSLTIIKSTASGANVVIENLINSTITDNFVNPADPLQKITGLSCTAQTSTTGTFEYATSKSTKNADYVSVDVLKDIITDAFNNGVCTEISLNIGSQTIAVVVKKYNNTVIIEGDLPNIVTANFTIKKTTKEINRFDAYDNYTNLIHTYYLYSDGTYGTDAAPSDPSKKRLQPVKNSVGYFNSYELAETYVRKQFEDGVARLANLLSANRTLTSEEYNYINGFNYGTPPGSTQFETRVAGNVYGGNWGLQSYFAYYTILNHARGGVAFSVDTRTTSIDWSTFPPEYRFYYDEYLAMSEYETNDYNRKITLTYSNFAMAYPNSWSIYSAPSSGFATEQTHAGPSGNARIGAVHEGGVPISHLVLVEQYSYTVSGTVEYYAAVGGGLVATRSQTINCNFICGSPYYFSDIRTEAGTADLTNQIIAYAPVIAASHCTELAATAFASNKYTNLIELTVKQNDTLVDPMGMKIGQIVSIIHDGIAYSSILTGKEIKGGLVKLIFGTIRLDLTKILNMKGV